MYSLSALNVYMKMLTLVYNLKKGSRYFMNGALFSFAWGVLGNTPRKLSKVYSQTNKNGSYIALVFMFNDCTTYVGQFVLFVVYIYSKDYDCIDFLNVTTSLL